MGAHHRLEDNFETAGLRCQVQQPGTANSKEAAHRIVQATMKREAGADDGIRTRDLRFTKPLLYQLSYVGGKRQTLHPLAPETSALL